MAWHKAISMLTSNPRREYQMLKRTGLQRACTHHFRKHIEQVRAKIKISKS